MVKKNITYVDFNGIERTEAFYFNLTQAEVTEMEMGTDGGFVESIHNIVDAKNGKQIISVFKDLILRSYGVKSPDGKRFIKTQEVRDEFLHSEPYSIIFMELATNAEAAAEFVNGIIPTVGVNIQK